MKKIIFLSLLALSFNLMAQNRYQPTWESLEKHTNPNGFGMLNWVSIPTGVR
ncbi:MAG: hypothetical protein ABI174_11115 [Chitinophagaceae bacterium]